MNETRQCVHCKKNFEITAEDFGFYEKMHVPAPTECPQCRIQHRMSFRNFKTLYKRTSDKSGKPIVSMYRPGTPFVIYSHEEWWADDWDAKSYGRDFDFNRPFFEQFAELLKVVPRFSIMNVQSESCQYSNLVTNSKNCYLVFGCVEDEDCAYGHVVWESKDSFDNLYVFKSQFCYECTDCTSCYNLSYSEECENCNESIGLFDCRSVANSIGCVGLTQKSYHIFNEQVSKEQHAQFLKDHPLHKPETIAMILKKQMELRKALPARYYFGYRNDNVSGNHINDCKNVHYSFDLRGGENSKFVFTSRKAADVYDVAFSPDIESSYYVLTGLKSNNAFFSHLPQASHHVYYCDIVYGSNNLFGCAGMRNASYCILNRQYSKEEYEVLVPKIIEHMKKTGEWGNFFPVSLSPFAYNEAIVNEYLPLSKEEALAQGFRWQDEIPSTVGQETTTYDELPKNPAYYNDELLKQILPCVQCKRNYKFIASEIAFYKRFGYGLPSECFNSRHQRRMNRRNKRELYAGACAKCGVAFETSYNPDQQKQFRLHCEKCYQQAMV